MKFAIVAFFLTLVAFTNAVALPEEVNTAEVEPTPDWGTGRGPSW